MPAPEAAWPLAEKAPPDGAVVSDCAVKLAAAPVTPALFVAVTDALPVGEAPVKVYAPEAFDQPLPAIAP